jgi:hypothetical protein
MVSDGRPVLLATRSTLPHRPRRQRAGARYVYFEESRAVLRSQGLPFRLAAAGRFGEFSGVEGFDDFHLHRADAQQCTRLPVHASRLALLLIHFRLARSP